MGLETGTYISDLIATNPLANDLKKEGDDHIRLLKLILKNTFPGATKPFAFPTTLVKNGDFTVLSTQQNTVFLIDTSISSVTATLPALGAGDAGWECSMLKTNTGLNPYYIAPNAGTIQSGAYSGLAKTRRCIPGMKSTVLWTGTAWIAQRVLSAPIASVLEFDATGLPTGYEWPSGQVLSSAAANYPDYFAVVGSGVTLDNRGRVAVARDDLGGSDAVRLGSLAGRGTVGGVGGADTHTILISQVQAHNHSGLTGSIDRSLDHTHGYSQSVGGNVGVQTSGGGVFYGGLIAANTGGSSGGTMDHLHAIGYDGGSQPHNNLQPLLVKNKILVVE